MFYYIYLYFTICHYRIHYTVQYCPTLPYAVLHCLILHYNAIHYFILHYNIPPCTPVSPTPLHYTTNDYLVILNYLILKNHKKRKHEKCLAFSKEFQSTQNFSIKQITRNNMSILLCSKNCFSVKLISCIKYHNIMV